jgi:hypothetical protein
MKSKRIKYSIVFIFDLSVIYAKLRSIAVSHFFEAGIKSGQIWILQI